ncbi:MAG TPA: oxygenase MpaB family protein [Mycobacterium sp.]|nr:oxygenase MpaB family protein [Mycobacterium sp.]HTX94043.1 oxygenase MpaB family protein [Mycobacterium sp.]
MAGAKAKSRWTDERLDKMRKQGDVLLDKKVEAEFRRGDIDAVNSIMQSLVKNDQPVPEDLPVGIREYLAQSSSLPEWADSAKIKRGQQIFETWGVLITLCLFCASLPSAYAAANGVKVLYLTAQLDTNTRRRVMETGQFLMDVLAVGGLDDDGKGRRTIQRVRLMHSAVRNLVKARNKEKPGLWDAKEWGTPINQEDLAGTLLSFSYVVVEPMPRLGVRLSDEDVDAYLHVWNVIGHLLGLSDEMLVHDSSDATALVNAIRRRQFRASPEGQEMAAALIKLLDELTPFHRFDDTIPPMIRHLIGDEAADMLLVPKSKLTDELNLVDSVTKLIYVHLFGQSERNLPRYQRMSRLALPFGRNLLHGIFRLERGGERARFEMPDHLARDWELST